MTRGESAKRFYKTAFTSHRWITPDVVCFLPAAKWSFGVDRSQKVRKKTKQAKEKPVCFLNENSLFNVN